MITTVIGRTFLHAYNREYKKDYTSKEFFDKIYFELFFNHPKYMKKSYYLFNPGRLSRKDNTLKFTPIDEDGKEGQPRYLPIETVDNLFIYGSLDANSAMYNFLGKNSVSVHFFDYYEHYTGSFMLFIQPIEILLIAPHWN